MTEIRVPLEDIVKWVIIATWAMQHKRDEVAKLMSDNKLEFKLGYEHAMVQAADFIAASTTHLDKLRAREQEAANEIIAAALAIKNKDEVM